MKIKLGKRKRRPKSKWKKLQDSKLKPTTCIITLSIKELSAPVKCQKLSNQIKKKQNPTICYLQEMYFKYQAQIC